MYTIIIGKRYGSCIMISCLYYFVTAEIICPVLETPANGQKSTDAVQVDTVLNFRCFVGYKVVGVSVLHCREDGRWNGTEPTCFGKSR